MEMLGSSPRVWGQDNGDRLRNSVDRIIPTRVGTSPLDGEVARVA